MKILQIVPYFFPAWSYGGPAKLVYDTSLFFVSQGHQVMVYTGDGYDQKKRMADIHKIDLPNLKVRYFRNVSNFLAYTYNIFITPTLYLLAPFELRKYDIIHIHDFYTLQNFYIGILSRIFKKPYILSVHGCLEEKRLNQQTLFKRFFLWLYGNQLITHASHLIASSENELLSYQAFGVPKNKISLLGHGVNPEEFSTQLSKSSSREKLNLPSKIIITYLGRIHAIKGLDRLVKAIEKLSKNPELHFVIAGSDDGYLSELNNLLSKLPNKKMVTVLGTCYGDTKAQLFKASDIFIYPSYSEGFSLGILEAAATGLPLIITTGCHFREVATKQAGLVVENEPELLADAILDLGNDLNKRLKFGRNAAQLIEDKYSMKAIGNKLLRLYASLI